MAGRGWRKFPFALVLEFSSCANGSWVRLLGGQIERIRALRPGLRYAPRAAPRPASIERDCERTLDDKFSPRGGEGREQSTPAKKAVLSLKKMEHQTDGDIATLSVTALKALITSAGLSYAGCVEKSDLRARGRCRR